MDDGNGFVMCLLKVLYLIISIEMQEPVAAALA